MSKRIVVVDPGHEYVLAPHEDGCPQTLQFIKKEPIMVGEPAMKTLIHGTSTEAVLEALIDRIEVLNNAVPCWENEIVMQKLCECLMWLEKRTRARMLRGVEGKAIQ